MSELAPAADGDPGAGTSTRLAGVVVAPARLEASQRVDLGGRTPAVVARPPGVDETAALLQDAAQRGLAVIPCGGGTALGTGGPPSRADVLLDLQQLDRVVEHSAADFVIEVEAGMRFQSLQERVAVDRQWLAVEPPDPEQATVGGMIAAAATSILAPGHGTLRNHLIGIRIAHPDGIVTRAGGRVVKNVAGYDLMKMHHGALGTLGVVVGATFRLRPLPERDLLVIADVEDLSALPALRPYLLQDGATPAAAWYLWSRGAPHGHLLLRLQGVAPAVDAQLAQVRPHLERRLSGLVLRDLEPGRRSERPTALLDLEQALSRGDDPSLVHLSIHGAPRHLPQIVTTCKTFAGELSRMPPTAIDLVRGVIWSSVPEQPEREAALHGLLRHLEGSARVFVHAAPVALRGELPAFEVPEGAAPLYRALRKQLDPARVLGPGRLDPPPEPAA